MYPDWRKNYLRYKSFFLNVVKTYKKREDLKTYLEITLSLITIIIFSVFALRPTLLTISQLLNEIKTKKETIEKMDQKIDALGRARALYENEQQRISLINIAVPENPSPDTFTQQAEGLVSKNSLTLSKVSMNNVPLKGAVQSETTSTQAEESFPFTLSVNGTYPLISQYLTDITNLKRPFQNNSIKVNSFLDSDKEQFVNLVIEGSLPYLKK